MQKTGENRKCENCGSAYYVPGWHLKKVGGGRFCSRYCSNISRKGEKMTEEHKNKISESHAKMEKSHAWRGGRIKRGGYILIYMPDHKYVNCSGYVREHRLKMERKLNRYLSPREVVHHIDGDRSNNKLNNLMLFPSNKEHIVYEKSLIK